MNRFQKHYGSLTVSELLNILLEHKLETQPLAPEWAQALVQVIESLQLQGEARQLFIRIQDTEPVALGLAAESIQQQIAALRAAEDREQPLFIDPAKILDAGKTLKTMVRIVAVGLLVATIIAIVLSCGVDYSTRANLLGLLVIGGILVQIVALGLLFNIGNTLQHSVRRSMKSPDKNT